MGLTRRLPHSADRSCPRLDSGSPSAARAATAGLGNSRPITAARSTSPRSRGGKRSSLEARRDEMFVVTVRERPPAILAADDPRVDQHGGHLLGEKRVAVGNGQDPVLKAERQVDVADEVPEHPRRVRARELAQLDPVRALTASEEAGVFIKQFMTGGTDDEQGNAV